MLPSAKPMAKAVTNAIVRPITTAPAAVNTISNASLIFFLYYGAFLQGTQANSVYAPVFLYFSISAMFSYAFPRFSNVFRPMPNLLLQYTLSFSQYPALFGRYPLLFVRDYTV